MNLHSFALTFILSSTEICLIPDLSFFESTIRSNNVWLTMIAHHYYPYLKSICLSMRLAVATRGSLPVERECSSRLEEMIWVVISVSAAVPAPQQLKSNAIAQHNVNFACLIGRKFNTVHLEWMVYNIRYSP